MASDAIQHAVNVVVVVANYNISLALRSYI